MSYKEQMKTMKNTSVHISSAQISNNTFKILMILITTRLIKIKKNG